MARRSPMNERYQKNTAPSGKTRKSAAAAKPKRTAAATSSSGKSSTSKSGTKSGTKRPPIVINPPTAEFRFWRRIWWILLIGSFVLTLSSLAVRAWLDSEVGANVVLFVAYAGLFAALGLDWWKLRKLRREWAASGGKLPAEEKPKKADNKSKKADNNPAAEDSSADDKS